MMQQNITDKASEAFQRLAWEALKKSINGLINKVIFFDYIITVFGSFAVPFVCIEKIYFAKLKSIFLKKKGHRLASFFPRLGKGKKSLICV